MNLPRFSPWDLGAATLMAFATALYTREIGNDFLWGHDGGNGAPYFAAAHASIRFGVLGAAKGYLGLTAPTPADYYTHHPLLLHAHLLVVRVLFGSAEWVGRLVPFFYSVAVLPLLHSFVRRQWNAPFALAAIAIYTLTPLHLIFATMIDHEQGAIFWSLVAVISATRAAKRARRAHYVGLAISATLAMQWAWASYFVLGATGMLMLGVALRAPRASGCRRRALSVSGVLLLTAIANVAAFALLIVLVKGGFHDMRLALELRSRDAADYGGTLLKRASDLYGVAILCVVGGGVLRFAWRARSGRLMTRDIVALSFALGQVGLSAAFPNAGRIHAYWTYFAGIAFAIVGAEALVAGVRRLRRRLASWLFVVLAALSFFMQCRISVARKEWGLATGFASYARAYDDQFELVQLAKALRQKYGRDTTYFVHGAARARAEAFYYFDAPTRTLEGIEHVPKQCVTTTCVLVVDLRAAPDGSTRVFLAGQAQLHPLAMFADHYVVVELSTTGRKPQAFLLEHLPATTAYAWFVSSRRPPTRWREIPADDLDKNILGGAILPTHTADSPASGKGMMELCPNGAVLSGIEIARDAHHMIGMRGRCGGATTRWMGAADVAGDERSCGTNGVVIGLGLAVPAEPLTVSLECEGGPANDAPYRLRCPPGSVGIGVRSSASAPFAPPRTDIHGRLHNGSLVGVGIACATIAATH